MVALHVQSGKLLRSVLSSGAGGAFTHSAPVQYLRSFWRRRVTSTRWMPLAPAPRSSAVPAMLSVAPLNTLSGAVMLTVGGDTLIVTFFEVLPVWPSTSTTLAMTL